MKLKHANVSDVKFPEFNALEFMTFDVMFQGCNFESYDIGGSWIKIAFSLNATSSMLDW